MKRMTATKAKDNFGEMLMNAMSDTIVITKNGGDKVVVHSCTAYRKMMNLIFKMKKMEEMQNGEKKSAESADIATDDIKS